MLIKNDISSDMATTRDIQRSNSIDLSSQTIDNSAINSDINGLNAVTVAPVNINNDQNLVVTEAPNDKDETLNNIDAPLPSHREKDMASCDIKTETNSSEVKLNLEQDDDFVTILHFNDCYNIEPGPQSSGAAGFLTAINQYKDLDPMILFSGDILSPSFMSTFTKGEQMIPVLNDIGVHCAVFGNHEFDYGVDNLIDFVKRTTFPWLLSNVIDKETSNQLGDGKVFHIIERAGFKFGLIGLIEEEWLSTLSTLDSSDVIYQDFVVRGKELAGWLKSDPHNVDYVIALTHFRTPNDIRLADSVPEIDLILGGHDHDYEIIKRPNCYIIKSGTDFREFSRIKLKINPQYKSNKASETVETGHEETDQPFLDLAIERIKCTSYEPDVELQKKLEKFVSTIDEKMGKVLGQFNCELDGRFSSIRKFETNLGNFVTDIMLASTHADLAILNSGTLRSDRIHSKGDFTMRDLFNILGYIDPIAVLKATGHHIWRALENGVSQWPKLEGRFPQVSGCSFSFDPTKPPMQRIEPKDIIIGDEPLVLDKQYRLTTKAYLASGKDGYDMLKECEILVPGDESPDLTTSILNHFEAINIVKSRRRTHHRQSIICLSRSSLKKILDETGCEANMTILPPLDCDSPPPTIKDELEQTQDHDNDDNNNLEAGESIGNRTLTDGAFISYPSPPKIGSINSEMVSASGSPSIRAAGIITSTPTSKIDNSMNSGYVDTPIPASDQHHHQHRHHLTHHHQHNNHQKNHHHHHHHQNQPQPRTKRLMSLYEMEHEQCKLEPKIEGRIKIVGINI